MEIKSLYTETAKQPRCQALRATTYYYDKINPEATDKQCKRNSKFKIDKAFYCKRHAEIRALKILLKDPKFQPIKG